MSLTTAVTVLVFLSSVSSAQPGQEDFTQCAGVLQSYASNISTSSEEDSISTKQEKCFPTWKYLEEQHVIIAQQQCSVALLRCYCLTSSGDASDPQFGVGHCFYGCFNTTDYMEYFTVTMESYQETCTVFNRTDMLCGKCIDGFSLPAYSFSVRCVPCQNITQWRRTLQYIAIAYGPLTVFMFMIVVFTVSVNSAPLHGWIFVCQMASLALNMRVLTTSAEHNQDMSYTYAQVFGSLFGIWNLDFFRSVYCPFCLHSSLTTLQVMSLDYIIAAYPLVIIVIMYVLVDLHSRDCRPVVVMWRPFHYCFARFRHQLNIRTSLVDAFGTFFSLSYVKFLSTTVDLIMPSKVWNGGSNNYSLHVYFDGSMQLFKDRHIPFGVLSMAVFSVCNVLPLVLILIYSFPQTQKLTSCFPVCIQRLLRPFMDNLLGCYKDGTNGTRNCRYFAVVYHVARIVYFSCFTWTESLYLYPITVYICIILGMLVAVIQPYKSLAYNTVDTILVLSLGLAYTGSLAFFLAGLTDPLHVTASIAITFVPLLVPILYIVGYVGYELCCVKMLPQTLLKAVALWLRALFAGVVQRVRRNWEMSEVLEEEQRVLIEQPTQTDVYIQ